MSTDGPVDLIALPEVGDAKTAGWWAKLVAAFGVDAPAAAADAAGAGAGGSPPENATAAVNEVERVIPTPPLSAFNVSSSSSKQEEEDGEKEAITLSVAPRRLGEAPVV